jgi:zinc protease
MRSPSRLARVWLLLLTPALLVAGTHLAAQRPAAMPPPSTATPLAAQTIPVDPLITVATLPNGLRYYVRPNAVPSGRAELRLVVKAGSVLEDDDQRGLAHFVEHMAFNGTTHFPKQAIAGFMQGIGMRFGAHVNAHTSFDETVYELQIPTTDPAVVEQALLIMEDFARGVTFEAEEVEKERGVILEEWRQGLGADARMQDAIMPVLLQGSRYAVRSPIGLPDIIRTAPVARLRQFYTDWYRPDLMAVIAVGDFDRAAMEAGIKAHFGPIPAATNPRPRTAYTVPPHDGTLYAVATDPEARATTVGLIGKMPARDQSTVGMYRQQMVERLFAGMLSERLDEMARTPDAPFQAARSSRGLFVRTMEATTMQALVEDGAAERGLTALAAEAERVAQFGFTASELDRQKVSSQRYLLQALAEKDKSPSGPLADEFIRNFMNDEPIPGIVREQGMAQELMPGITLEEVNRLAASWLPDANRVVVVNAPERTGLVKPTAATLGAALGRAGARPLTAYVDTVNSAPLLDPLPAPGKVAETTTKESLGITEWRLSNGARVVLKPTDFKADEVLFRAISPGGTSLAPDRDFVPALTAENVMAESGLGRLNLTDLNKALSTVNAAVRADIGDTDEGLVGGASRRDLETMFQLIHLTFTAPRADATAFAVLQANLKRALANQEAQPEAAFARTLAAALTGDHPRARPLTPEMVDQMSLEKSLAFYKDRFADASDFTFVFVGSFDLPTIRPLVERYLASLPSIDRTETPRDVGIRFPETVIRREVRKGVEPKSQVSIVFPGTFENTEANRILISTMAATLSGNLHRVLREDLGGTYGVSVEPNFGFRPIQEYRVSISFACDPARLDELLRDTWRVIADFKANGPSSGQIADGRLAARRDWETNLQQNPYWLNRITQSYSRGEDVAAAFDPRPYYDQLTAESVRDAARRYLDESRYVEVVLRPETR